jgi:polyhydroxyalkanoate synthesis regulator phasin
VARDADVAAAFQRLNEVLRTIRTMLAIIGVIAVAALGLAVWALLRNHDVNNSGNRRGLATQADLAATNGRIDRLSAELSGLRGVAGAGARGAQSVSSRLGALEQQVKQLNARPNPAGQASTLQSLSGRVDKLAADVAQLKANPPSQSQTQTTTTTS